MQYTIKILIIHNFYTELTGEDLIVKETSSILRDSTKTKVIEYYKYSADFHKFPIIKKLAALIKGNIPFYIPRDFKEILEREKPNFAHIHNFIPLINIWVLKELHKRKIPIIYDIQNYRIFCPRGTCFLKNRFCEKCFDKFVFFCIFHNCLDNLLYSLLYVYRVFLQRLFLRYIDIFVSPTNFVSEFYKKRLPMKNNIAILKGYIHIPEELKNSKEEKKDFVIFAGRLVKEKGVQILLKLAGLLKSIKFKICGDGPELQLYKNLARRKDLKNIEFLGLTERTTLLKLIKDAQILIFPSLWYEICGRITGEAMLLGTSVIASNRGSNAELIQHNKTGFLFDPDDIVSLANTIKKLCDDEALKKNITIRAYEHIKGMDDSEEYLKNFHGICQSFYKESYE